MILSAIVCVRLLRMGYALKVKLYSYITVGVLSNRWLESCVLFVFRWGCGWGGGVLIYGIFISIVVVW